MSVSFYLPSKWESTLNPTTLRKSKIVYNFGLSECNKVEGEFFLQDATSFFNK